jgi:dihydropteroate synthase
MRNFIALFLCMNSETNTLFPTKVTLRNKERLLLLDKPIVMGILNIAPDSFYDGGKYTDATAILKQAEKIIAEGADIIDIGAYSSRPGAENISFEEEWNRLSRALDVIRSKYEDVIISVDTFRAEIVRKSAHEYKVQIINDISGGLLDPEMLDTIISLNLPYIIMHMAGNPQNMQKHTNYTNVIDEILRFLGKQADKLISKGARDIIIDPGFGFGKSLEQNYQLLSHLDIFKTLEMPILVGFSRKSMIYRHLGITSDEALNGTEVLNTIALMKGADILRVHDVKETKQAISLYSKTVEEGKNYLKQASY